MVRDLRNFLGLGLLAVAGWLGLPQNAEAALLVGNTRGNNIVAFDETTGSYLGQFIKANQGLLDPDTMVIGPDGNLYISSGTTAADSAIYRFDAKTGKSLGKFASGGGLTRPYGIAFGPDGDLYVSSFLTDQVLVYDGQTGAFKQVFAERDKNQLDPLDLNGPNGLFFGPDGTLYITTQGSVAVNGQPDFGNGFPSLVLKYDTSGNKGVFINQPTPSPDSFNFVSFLGITLGPDGDLYVSDFANDIRRYDFATGTLIESLSTNYTGTVPSNNFMGSLAFAPNGDLFTVGFDFTQNNIGSILKYDFSSPTKDRSVVALNAPQLKRPIGVLFAPDAQVSTPEPGIVLGLLGLGVLGWRRRAR